MKYKYKKVIEIETEDEEMPLLGYNIKKSTQSRNESGIKRAVDSLENLNEGCKEYVDSNGKIYYITVNDRVNVVLGEKGFKNE